MSNHTEISDVEVSALSHALLRWINTLSSTVPVTSLVVLQDGHVMWQALQKIGPDYFTQNLPHEYANGVEMRWQNCESFAGCIKYFKLTFSIVKFIKDCVTSYLTEQCEQPEGVLDKLNPNLRAVAVGVEDDDTIEVAVNKMLDNVIANTTVQLLKFILLAAAYSPESNQELVATLRNLSKEDAGAIQSCIEELAAFDNAVDSVTQNAEETTTADGQHEGLPTRTQDPKLALEEQLIQARIHSENLQKHNTLLAEQLEEARYRVKQLKQEAAATHTDDVPQPTEVSIMQKLSDEHADNVALLEQELYDVQTKMTSQSKQIARLVTIEASCDKLQFELDLLRDERDELEQKSNASENLKKKLKALQEAQTHNDLLRQDYDLAQQELDELRPLREQHADLQRRLQELTQHFQSLETSNQDEHIALARAENELSLLNQSLIESREQHERDQEQLGEYQSRIRSLESAHEDLSFASLDQELSTLESPLQSPESSLRTPTTPGTQTGGEHLSASANSEVIVSQQLPILPTSPQIMSMLGVPERARRRRTQDSAMMPTIPASAHGHQVRPRLKRGISVKMTIDVIPARLRLPVQDPLPVQPAPSIVSSWIPFLFPSAVPKTNKPFSIF